MKKSLLSQKNRYLAIIYDDVIKHKPIREIHRDLLKSTLNPNKRLLAYVMKLANRAKKLDKGAGAYYETGLDVLAGGIITLFMTDATNYKANKLINSEIRRYESERKAEILDNAWKMNRRDERIFYIASEHRDSAADHEPWQGKIYVDRYWHNYDVDGRLGEFIRSKGIRTVQWVVGKPVWFVTRPNCRHYFVNYGIEDILKGKYKIPHRIIGDKRLQTPQQANLQYYQDRLRLLETMYKRHQTDLLRKQILKTKILITKWKNMV